MIRKTIQIALVAALALSLSGCRWLSKDEPVTPIDVPDTTIQPPRADSGGSGNAGDNDITGDKGVRPTGAYFPVPKDMVKTVYFDYDKSGIRADQRADLEKTADFLKTKPTWKVRVDGHCDERGTLEYNMALGGRRAESVVAFLVSRGVPADRLLVASRGEEEPAVAGTGEAVWAKNRRAEFFYSED